MNTLKKIYKSKWFDRVLTTIIILLAIYILVIKFVGSVSTVDGTSMMPTLKDKQTLVYRNAYNNFKRFDIALIKVGDKLETNDEIYSSMHNENIVKRIIGLENETIKIQNESLYVNNKLVVQNFEHKQCKEFVYDKNNQPVDRNICNQEIKVPSGYVYVLGDNRSGSTDSRFIGPVKKDSIWGIAIDAKLK